MKPNQQRIVAATSQSPGMKTPPKTMDGRNLYSINEARERLGGISRNTIYELLGSGRLASVQIGRRRFVSRDALDAFVVNATTTQAPSRRAARPDRLNFATMRLPTSGPERTR